MQPSLGVVVAAVVVVVVETVLLSRPHWHKPSTSHGHQDCPPKAHGAQWSSVAACVFPGTAAHVLQLMQLSLASVVVEAVLLVEVGGVVAAVVVVVVKTVLLSRPHWHKPSTSHGHQDCPPKAHGAQWSSVAACVF